MLHPLSNSQWGFQAGKSTTTALLIFFYKSLCKCNGVIKRVSASIRLIKRKRVACTLAAVLSREESVTGEGVQPIDNFVLSFRCNW